MLRSVGMLAVVLIGAVTVGSEANAQSPRSAASRAVQAHLDEQASELRSQVARLTGELRERSQRSDYRRLYRESTELFYLADHLHETAHEPLNVAHLSEDVEDLDRVFHRMEDLARDLDGGFHRNEAFHDDHRHSASSISGLLDEIEDTLHHLRDDLAQLRRPPPRAEAPRPRPGISFGNGRFRIELED